MIVSQCRTRHVRDSKREGRLTFVEDIAHGTVINDHDLAQVGFNLGQVLDISPIAKRAVLPIVSSREVLALHFQPVNNRVGIFLHRGREYNQVVPFTNLG